MQPSQDKRRPARRNRPRASTPTSRTGPLGWRVEEARERIRSRTEIEDERTRREQDIGSIASVARGFQ